jgi:hypothetical protein
MLIIQPFDFINVQEKAKALGCNVPTGLALLPYNFENAKSKDELRHEQTVRTVRTLFNLARIKETKLELEGETYPERPFQYYMEWRGPIIFTSLAALDEDPFIFNKVMEPIRSYLRSTFLSKPEGSNAILDAVVEQQNKVYKRLHYEGPVYHLNDYLKEAAGLVQLTDKEKSVSYTPRRL